MRLPASELRITYYSDGIEIEGNTYAADQVARNMFGPGPWRISNSDRQYAAAAEQCKYLASKGAQVVHMFNEPIARYCQEWPDLSPATKDTPAIPPVLVYACTTLIAFGLVAIGYIVGVVAS